MQLKCQTNQKQKQKLHSYKKDFFLFQNSLKYNWVFKAKVVIINYRVYNLGRSKIYDSGSTKTKRKK